MDDGTRASLLDVVSVFERQRAIVASSNNDFAVFLIDLAIMELRVQAGSISELELAEISAVLRDKLATK